MNRSRSYDRRLRWGVATLLATAGAGLGVHAVAQGGTAHPPASATAGLQAGRGPWAPEHRLLAARLATLGLPGQSDAGFHIHALVRVYVEGHAVTVPPQIGIDPAGRFIAPLHTHDASGIVHLEATRPHPFTLGEFFTVWGVRFGDGRIGGYADHGMRRLRVFVNGRPVAHPARYVLRSHDRVVVAFGRPGASPTSDHTAFRAGL